MKSRSLVCLTLTLMLAGYGFSQSKTTGTIGGTITDATDSSVPNASLTATNTETGAAYRANSDTAGSYLFPLLPPGVYDLKVEKAGFATQTRKGIPITVGESTIANVTLVVSASNQVVEVQAEAPPIETSRTQQSNTITERVVRNLPIDRRDYLSFTLLAPGVADSKALADSNSFRVKQTPDSGISFYGSNGRGNNVSIDGGESNDGGGGVRPTVSQEAVQEFQINRTNYTAEHGDARGGVIDIVTKSGSNAMRGSIFGFFRHQGLDATDRFAIVLNPDNRLARVRPDSGRQQFGGTIGGPIAKNRSFYFLAYEQQRRRESKSVPVLTDLSIFQPTLAQQAILAQLPAPAAEQLRTALTSPPSTVQMFRNNSGIFPFQTDSHQGLLRLDHRFNDANQGTFRYNITRFYETNQNLGALVGYSRGYITDNFDSTALAGWTHTFSPRVVNQARAQFNYDNPITETNDPHGPALEIAGFGFFNRDRFLPTQILTRRYDLADSLTVVKSRHALNVGANVLIRQQVFDSKTFFSGRFTFGTLPAALVNPVLGMTTITALQAFNLGLAQSYQQGFGDSTVRGINPLYAVYGQDTWRVRPNLMLNFGLRYQIDQRIDPLPTMKNAFAPRFGFAWDPLNDKKGTIRGGYGMFFSTIDFQIDYVVRALNEIDGYRQIAQVLTTLNPASPLARNGPINIFTTLRAQGVIGVPTPQRPIVPSDLQQFGITVSQTGPRPPLTVLFRPSPDYQNPYAHQASLGIDREIVKGLTASIEYVHVRGVHLTTSYDQNLLPAAVNPATGVADWGVTASNPTGFGYFRDPLLFQDNVYAASANSWYHGLLTEVKANLNSNVNVVFNYTYSKAQDETVDYNSDFQANNQLCRSCERALSSFDQRHKVVAYAVLQSRGGPGALRKVFGNILLTPIFRYNSARPFNLLTGTELNNDRHNTTDRPYFAGRNVGIGPTFRTFDARLSRRISLRERASLELTFEAFNLFNNLNYSSVNNTVACNPASQAGSPGSCYISDIVQRNGGLKGNHANTALQAFGFTSAFEPRRLQLGLRIRF